MSEEAEEMTASDEVVPAEHQAEVEERVEQAYQIVGHPGPAAGIIARLNYVQQLIDYVGKTGTSGDGYQFRTIDGVLKALHGPLGKAGVVVIPNVVDHYERDWTGYKLWGTLNGKFDTWAGSKEGIEAQMAMGDSIPMANPNRIVRLTIEYQLWCEPETRGWGVKGLLGSNTAVEHRAPMVSFTAVGEGIDNSDKAVGKAMSYAYKAVMSQVFSIPTEQPEMDSEHANQRDQQAGVATQESWWQQAGWHSEQQAVDARKKLLDRVRAYPDLTQEHVKRWMNAFELEQGSWQRAALMRDSRKKSVAAVFSIRDALQFEDKLDDVAAAAAAESAGEEPFPVGQEDDAEAAQPPQQGEPAAAPGSEEREGLVMDALADNFPDSMTTQAMAEATGLSRAEAQSTLDALISQKAVSVTKVGRNNVYALTPEPEPEAEVAADQT